MDRSTSRGPYAATADGVRQVVELLAINPVCTGSAPKPLAKLGIVRAVAFAKTGRPTAHARR